MVPRVQVGAGEVVVLATVQGLVAERDRALALLEAERPAVVALGVSVENVAALLRYEPSPEVDPYDDLMEHDIMYSVRLEEFGEVSLPPPDLMAAARWARDAAIPCFGVDLAEEEYATRFTKLVSTFGFLRYGRIQRRLARKPPKAKSPRELALVWDAAFRKVKGIRLVEAEREAHMAAQAARLARETPGRVVLILDVAREAGVLEALAREASTP